MMKVLVDMTIKKLLRQFMAGGVPGERSPIYSAKEFKRLVDRERERADRSGQVFSIVTFDLENYEIDKDKTRFTERIIGRVRSTDDVGWFDDDHLGILLFNTNLASAKRFADRFLISLPPDFPKLKYHVHSYPVKQADQAELDEDKRRAERFNLQVASIVAVEEPDETGITIDLVTRDISASGAFFNTVEPLPLGTDVKIKMVFPLEEFRKLEGDTVVISTSGTVARTDDHGMAIAFNGDYVFLNSLVNGRH
jgi:hypothetical protein